jgi:hypothetical protein
MPPIGHGHEDNPLLNMQRIFIAFSESLTLANDNYFNIIPTMASISARLTEMMQG